MDKTNLAYWFPKLEAAGLPVPRTMLLPMPREAFVAIYKQFDGEPMGGGAEPFFVALRAAADAIGYPAFLRTGHTSAKHEWENTCYVADGNKIASHVTRIIHYGELMTLQGLPCGDWAVREFLPTTPIAIAPRFDNMPVCREFRFFVDGGAVKCWHPYWPVEALEQGAVENAQAVFDQLNAREGEEDALRELASKAGAAIGGAWSVDILDTKRGWFITDMAEAEKSYHWPGCSSLSEGTER